MATVEFDRVSFAYAGEAPLLQACSFRLASGVTGLVGQNGAGKTTLLRLIMGTLVPDSGQIRRLPADLRIACCDDRLEQASQSVQAFQASRDAQAHRLRVRFDLLEHVATPWGVLSPGLRRRLQLAAALYEEPGLWLLDEPSNHVDLRTRKVLIEALVEHRGSTLLVSHDRALIDAVASRTLSLSRGELRSYEGGYSAARRAIGLEQDARASDKAERERVARRAQRTLSDARRVQASADQARSTRARMKGVHDHDARGMGRKVVAGWAEARAGRTVEVQRRSAARAREHARALFVDKPLGRRLYAEYVPCPRPQVLELHTKQLGYPGRVVLRDLHLTVDRSARVHIEGDNGAGKTTLLSALYQSACQRTDQRVLYVPQEITTQHAQERLRALHALEKAEKGRVLDLVAALGVEPDRLLRSAAPSAGEARKLWIALGLGRGAHALLLDEPTNDLDLPAVERLEAALESYPGALLVITHDAQFARSTLRERWRVAGGVVRGA